MTGLATRVSVVIPAFNAAGYVAAAVASAIRVGSDDVIVVDDGSTDATVAVAREAGATVVEQVNSGASLARRRGHQECRHDLVVFLDADDELLPAGVARSCALLAEHPDAVAVGGLVEGVLPDGTSSVLARPTNRDLSVAGLLRAGHGPWPPAAAVVRRLAVDQAADLAVPVLPTRYAEDYELVLRLALVGPVLSHQEVSARYRMHVGKSSRNALAPLVAKEEIRRHYARELGLDVALMTPRELRAAALMRRSRFERAHRQRSRAAALAATAVAIRPLHSLRSVRALVAHPSGAAPE